MAPGRPCAEAEIAARRLALRHQAALEPLGTSPDASTLQHGPSFGAVGTVYHVARRFGIAQALGTTRAGQLALWHVSARGIAPGSRLAAGRLALAHAACDGLGCGTFAADALEAHLDGLAGAQARRAARLCAPRPKTQPARRLVSAGTRSSLDGPPHALAAFGSHRAGHTGTLQRGLGWLGDEDGPPVAIAVVPGNPPAPQTLAAQGAKRPGRCGVQALPVVGDRGMIQRQPSDDLVQQGFPAMTALTQPQMDNLRRPGTCPRARVAPELAEGLAEEGVRSGLRRQPWRAHDMQATRHAPRATLQAPVAPQHPSLPDPPRAHAQGALQTLGARAAKLRLADGVARTVAERAMTRPLKADAPTAAATLAGCSGLQTALTPAPAPTERVQDRDQARAAVAQACRAGTTVPLAGRPLCWRRAARTRAQAVVVRLAYPSMRSRASCWSAGDVTVAEGLHALTTRCLVAVAPHNAPSSHGRPTPRDAIARFLHRADSTLPKAFSLSGTRVSTKKKRPSERLVQ